MDFGIASLAGAPALTATGEVVGTLAYMAPEQAEGEVAGEPADVYSLALTLYECWAGATPSRARRRPRPRARSATGSPPLRDYRPDLPRASPTRRRLPRPGARRASRAGRASRDARGGASARSTTAVRSAQRPTDAERPRRPQAPLRAAQLLALCVGAWRWRRRGPVGRPGLALVLGALSAPAILVATRLAVGRVPALAPLLGARSSAAPTRPSRAAGATPIERAVLGALGWCWLAGRGGALGVGLAPRAGAQGPGRLEPLDGVRGRVACSRRSWPRRRCSAPPCSPWPRPCSLGDPARPARRRWPCSGALLWSAGLEAALRRRRRRRPERPPAADRGGGARGRDHRVRAAAPLAPRRLGLAPIPAAPAHRSRAAGRCRDRRAAVQRTARADSRRPLRIVARKRG